jgi:hypothetical protein
MKSLQMEKFHFVARRGGPPDISPGAQGASCHIVLSRGGAVRYASLKMGATGLGCIRWRLASASSPVLRAGRPSEALSRTRTVDPSLLPLVREGAKLLVRSGRSAKRGFSVRVR